MNILARLLVLSASFLLLGSKCDCIENPVDDGATPRAGISVLYKSEGQEIVKEFNSAMTQPSSLMGFEVFLPKCTPYSLLLTGGDGGGVSSTKLASVEFANTPAMPITKPYFTVFNRNLSSCIKTGWIDSLPISQHNDKRVHYELTVTDISGARSVVKIIAVPEHASNGCDGGGSDGGTSCYQTGTFSKWLQWNQDLSRPRWTGTLQANDVSQYCSGLKIRKVKFDIFTDCDSITSLEWHVRLGNSQYDGIYDEDPNNPKHVRVEVDTLVPLEQLPVQVWSDRFVLSDYSFPACETGRLPQIDVHLSIDQ